MTANLALVRATLSRQEGEEADALVLVGTDTGDDDDVLLPPLERVHARHLDILVHLGVQGTLK